MAAPLRRATRKSVAPAATAAPARSGDVCTDCQASTLLSTVWTLVLKAVD